MEEPKSDDKGKIQRKERKQERERERDFEDPQEDEEMIYSILGCFWI